MLTVILVVSILATYLAWTWGFPEPEAPGPHLQIKAEIQAMRAKRLKEAQESYVELAVAAE